MSLGNFDNQLTIQGIAKDLIKTGLNMTEAQRFVNNIIGFDQPNFLALQRLISTSSKISDTISSFVGSKANCSMGIICYANDPNATIVNDITGTVNAVIERDFVSFKSSGSLSRGYPLSYALSSGASGITYAVTNNADAEFGSFRDVSVVIKLPTATAANIDAVNGLYLTVKAPVVISAPGVGSGVFNSGTYSLLDSTNLGTTAQPRSVYITCPSVQLDRISNTCVISFLLSGDELYAEAWAGFIVEAIEGSNTNFVVSVAGSTRAGSYFPPAQAAVAAANASTSVQTAALGLEAMVPVAQAIGLGALGNYVTSSGGQLVAGLSSVYDDTLALANSLVPKTGQAIAGESNALLATSEEGAAVAETFTEGAVAATSWLADLELMGEILAVGVLV